MGARLWVESPRPAAPASLSTRYHGLRRARVRSSGSRPLRRTPDRRARMAKRRCVSPGASVGWFGRASPRRQDEGAQASKLWSGDKVPVGIQVSRLATQAATRFLPGSWPTPFPSPRRAAETASPPCGCSGSSGDSALPPPRVFPSRLQPANDQSILLRPRRTPTAALPRRSPTARIGIDVPNPRPRGGARPRPGKRIPARFPVGERAADHTHGLEVFRCCIA